METVAEVKAVGSLDSGQTVTSEPAAKPPPFKDPTFMVSVCVQTRLNLSACSPFCSVSVLYFCLNQHSGIGGAAAGKKNRTWKNLKQILALERTLPWKLNDPNCEGLVQFFFHTRDSVLHFYSQ